MSWAAIFAGGFVSLAVWLLLHVLGLGIGLTAIDPDDPGSLRGVGIGTGVWSLIAPVLALFVGGLLMGRLAGAMHRFRGAIHGAILWSVVTVSSVLLLASAIGALVGNVAQVSGRATSARAAASAPTDLADLAMLGLSASDLLAPVNRRLAVEGKAAISADQLGAAAREVLRLSARQGRLDREVLVSALAANTALGRADAGEIAVAIEQRWNLEHSAAAARGLALEQQALEAAESTGKALIGFCFALVLALASAIVGATVGVVREKSHPTTIGALPTPHDGAVTP